MTESYTPREFIEKINAENNGPSFDPYGVESLIQKQQQTPDSSILNRAKSELKLDKKDFRTPEAKIAEVKAQIEAMRQWLINDGTYTADEVDNIIGRLLVEYDEARQEAVVVGNLYLSGLQSAEHLTLPQSIGGDLYLSGLQSAEGLTLPQSIGGYLILDGLESAEHLTLPQTINGALGLNGLTSAEGLTLPQSIGGYLNLNGLTSAEGLTLPQTINGSLDLNGLTPAERNQIRAQRPDLADKIWPKD